jgi:hypothetical protein
MDWRDGPVLGFMKIIQGHIDMWNRFLMALALLIILTPGESVSICQGVSEFPFRPGERLTFELKWEFISAGTAVLEVLPMAEVDGVPARHFLLTVNSNSFIDNFYMVRDTIEAFTDEALTRSLLYKKRQQEGKHRRDIVVKFDWQKEEALFSNFGKPSKPIRVLPGTFDPFSIFYAFRLCNLKENIQLDASVSDGKSCVAGKAKVLKRQLINVQDRKYDTFLIEPDLKDVGGVFKKSRNARFQIWVTNDDRKLPVRVASSVSVGSFTAELVSVDHPPVP